MINIIDWQSVMVGKGKTDLLYFEMLPKKKIRRKYKFI
jgi:hypothetical protein